MTGTPFWYCLFVGGWLSSVVVITAAKEERQYLGAFPTDGLEFVGVDAQRLQDRRSNLGGGHWCLDRARMQDGVRDDKADIGVAKAKTAVLGVFLGRPGIDRAVDRPHDDVGRATIGLRAVEL